MKNIQLPLTKEKVKQLEAGEKVLLSGYVLTARDEAHKLLYDMILEKEEIPFSLEEECFYYTGPTPSMPGRVIGSAGPTTSSRMDKYTPLLMKNGLLGMIGKGSRSKEVQESIRTHGGVYFGATGGAGALLSTRIISSEILAFPHLGTEAIRKLYIKDFPVIVLIDSKGKLYPPSENVN